MKICPNCKKIYNGYENYCLKDNYRLVEYTDEESKQDQILRMEQERANQQSESLKPKCPTCGSTNLEKISDTKKVVGALAFGLLSKTARSQFKCRNCGYKW